MFSCLEFNAKYFLINFFSHHEIAWKMIIILLRSDDKMIIVLEDI